MNSQAQKKENRPTEPKAKKIETILEKHGEKRVDSYYWMNKRDSEDVLSYLKEENDYLEKIIPEKNDLRSTLYEEMKARILKEDQTAPIKKKSYYYYSKTKENLDYSFYYRKKDFLDNKEELVLDENILAKGQEFFNLAALGVSPGEDLAAYSVDLTGRRIYSISVKNLISGETQKDIIEGTTGNFTWGKDNKTLFYTKRDLETLRSHELWSYNFETKKSTLLFEEKDTTYSIDVSKSSSNRYIFLESGSTLTTETSYLDLESDSNTLKVFSPRKQGVEYTVEDGEDSFYILTNLKNKNFSLMKTSKEKTNLEEWENVSTPDNKVLLTDLLVAKNFIALRESHEGLLKIRLIDRKTNKSHFLKTNDSSYDIDFHSNPTYSSDDFNYTYESLTTPFSVLQYDTNTGSTKILKEKKVLGDFNPSNYISKRIFAKARDGETIPISLVHRKDLKPNSKTPLLQYAYGSYGHTIYPYFSTERLSLLDRGFVFAICHIRGGSYKGREWYENGKMFHKKNTFNDFIDSSKFLIEENYTSSEHLYAQGGSAGGLLMGAIINMNPELYNGVLAIVPFVDVVTTMLDDTIPLTTFEYDEWGNPNKKDEYEYIKSYSPYDNIEEKKYSNLLVMTGYHDSQVQYWEPAKWVAKLREKRDPSSQLLFYTDFSSGHSGASGRFEHLKDVALVYSFIIKLEEKNI